jgi:hypothetical protein
VVYKLVSWSENEAISVVSFSQTFLSLILLYSKNRLFFMICILYSLVISKEEHL